ncbi:tripartite tricarboxylate transporter substrate binding protein [Variovorax sp. J22R24]|uniref:tripartite tricarboxylate transporter substrate binding protein n=1 Tax=Variovorax gracilis TaxID=3053502 RepID=UPI0025769CB7|nr:tripartite tricarboxylate transporter substrate binding protein [Variovorax sp. J22R24]MDM0108531.1 tripartite tricarboxylate transporter substrate binding protein [Variovorax sp. J22R24]
MISSTLSRLAIAALAAGASATALPAHSAWPDKPIRLVVPSSPGGSADAIARLVGDRLSRAMGQPVLIDNKGGGGGNIATEAVVRSPADGYTLLLTGNNHPLNVSLFAKPPYKLDDFASVIELTRGPSIFVAAPNAPFSTLRELIDKSKASPGSIAYGSPGIGLPSHIAFEMFQRTADVTLAHAPYKGSGPSLADAMGGQIPVVSATLGAALPHVKAGKLKALAVTSEKRWPTLPDVPTVTEVIGKPFVHLTWLGILAPKGTPAPILAQLNAELNKVISDPAVKTAIDGMGTTAVGGTALAFQKVIDDEAVASKALVQSAKLRAD